MFFFNSNFYFIVISDRMSDNEIAQYESLLKTLPQAQQIVDEDVSKSLVSFLVI